MFVAENADEGWGPAPRLTVGAMNQVSAIEGIVTYEQDGALRVQAVASFVGLIALLSLAILGRRLR